MSLSTRTRYVSGFVSLAGKTVEEAHGYMDLFKAWATANCESFAYILHDLDTKVSDDGGVVAKTLHFHFVCVLQSACRVSTFINRVADTLSLRTLAITADKCSSLESSVQYLTHKNDPEKYQYPESRVVRVWDDGDFRVLMESEPNQVSFDYFYRVCSTADSLVDVIRSVGISKYHAYRNTLMDIFKATH